MRRIYTCVLVLGIMGALGFGVVRGVAQSEGPVLPPSQVQPASFSAFPGNPAATAAPGQGPVPIAQSPAPAISIPYVPPMPQQVVAPPIPDLPGLSDPSPKPPTQAVPPMLVPRTQQPQAPAAPAPSAPKFDQFQSPKAEQPAPAVAAPLVESEPMLIKPPTSSQGNDRPAATTLPEFNDPKRTPSPTPTSPMSPMSPTVPFTNPSNLPSMSTRPASNRVAPIVSIESIAPESVGFGQQFSYEIVVRNEGQVPVTSVRVEENLGHGAKLISSLPMGEISGDKVSWNLGALSVADEKRIKVNVKPGTDGDLQTHPRVSYSAGTAMVVRINRPNLVVSLTAPEAVMIGEEVPVQINICNNGTGEAGKIVLKAVLSDGLKHPEGNDIQAAIARLAPGETQNVTLRVQAAIPGEQSFSLSAVSEGTAKVAKQAKLEVRQPKLNLALSGPAKCMVRSEPTFQINVTNPGNCPTDPVQLAAAFPEGLEFVSASDGGTYDPTTRTVMWNLGPAAASSNKPLTIKTRSNMAGNLAVRAVAQAGPKLHARAEAIIHAQGVPSLYFEVADSEDPIEVGKETTYEIHVTNRGSTDCTNVKLSVGLTDGLSVGTVSSTVPHKIIGQMLVFEPIGKMPVKTDLVIRVKAKGTTPGDQRFKVQLACDQFQQPVVKEESTSVFQQ